MTIKEKVFPTLNGFVKTLFRRKIKLEKNVGDLSRCLTTFDLTNLGIGSILGAGIYVVVGKVAAKTGPSVFLSVIIAAITSLLSGLCYAEFGSRVPRTTGSAYSYSYHTVGEIIAFVIGWNLILEYMIGTAADARALSGAINYLLDHRISNFSLTHIGKVPITGATPDILGFILTLTVTMVLAAGVKESARYTVLFNILTGLVACFIVIAGSTKSNVKYWSGTQKFFPQGTNGVLSGAATCFYAFVGYDIIATTGEEAKSPNRSIPLAISLTLFICLTFYLGVAAVLTMMVPYGHLITDSPITEAFDLCSMHWAKWIVGLGGVAGMSASLMGSEFPLPRIIYAMACDGLIFKIFTKVWSRTEVPIYATLIPGIMTAFFTMLFDLNELVEMMSIGTLLAYSLVCTSILLLRYQFEDYDSDIDGDNNKLDDENDSDNGTQELQEFCVVNISDVDSPQSAGKHVLPFPEKTNQNQKSTDENEHATNSEVRFNSYKRAVVYVVMIWIFGFCLALIALFGEDKLIEGHKLTLSLFVIILFALVICIICLTSLPQNTAVLEQLHFKVPLVPLLPCIAIVSNLVLMIGFSTLTWIRFGIWMSLGFFLYFGYGIRYSKLSQSINNELWSYKVLTNHIVTTESESQIPLQMLTEDNDEFEITDCDNVRQKNDHL